MAAPRVRRSIPASQKILARSFASRLSPFQRVQDPRISRLVSGYSKFRRDPRLARSTITNPFDFNTAENVALRNARQAQTIFNSSTFRREYKTLPVAVQKMVVDEYRKILKKGAAMRLIAKKERLVHDRTPSVFNRRAFDALVFNRLSQPHKGPFSVGMVDLDYFGKVNKRFGQESGNFVLTRFAEELSSVCAKYSGFAGRVGGEEFQFYLPIDPARAKVVIDDLRQRFAQITSTGNFRRDLQTFYPKDNRYWANLQKWGKPVQFTAAVTGGLSLEVPFSRPENLFAYADAAMQKGKKAGRARTMIARLPKAA